ncbi:MAG: methionine synthase [candidate division KSB1 bacterium]|nr:methionine synthase [candidate division KSB1 bacterium]
MALLTTTVGSFPKPEYLTKARTAFSRGQISRDELRQKEEQATRECIALQERLGLDILVDGEMYRGDMATYFAEHLEGFRISGLVRSYGNRYYRKPIIVGPVRWRGPITVEWFRFAQSLTQKPVKAILTGPYTMMDWSFDEFYASRREAALDLAHALHEEVLALKEAGARYFQIDEPAISTRPEEIDLALETMRIVTAGLEGCKTITHICYGEFDKIYPRMLDLAVDQIDLEMSNSGFDMLQLFRTHPFRKEIGLGVIDVHTHVVEDVDTVVRRIEMALEVFRPEQVYVDPDCGLKTRTPEEAEAKLRVMVEARDQVRARLGLS